MCQVKQASVLLSVVIRIQLDMEGIDGVLWVIIADKWGVEVAN